MIEALSRTVPGTVNTLHPLNALFRRLSANRNSLYQNSGAEPPPLPGFHADGMDKTYLLPQLYAPHDARLSKRQSIYGQELVRLLQLCSGVYDLLPYRFDASSAYDF